MEKLKIKVQSFQKEARRERPPRSPMTHGASLGGVAPASPRVWAASSWLLFSISSLLFSSSSRHGSGEAKGEVAGEVAG
jgi:hypothetical protein